MSDEEIIEGGEIVTRDAPLTIGDGRTIDVRLFSYGEVATETNEGIRETFARGALSGVDPSSVALEAFRHGGPVVGRAESIEEREDGAYATFRVFEGQDGDQLLHAARSGMTPSASAVFNPIRTVRRPGGIHERQAVLIGRVAVLPQGAYPSAQVLAVRNAPEETVTDTAVDLSPVTSAIETLTARIGALETLSTVPDAVEAPELFRMRSLGEYAARAYAGPSAYASIGTGDMLARDLADNLTSENPGLVPPAWLSEVKGIVNLSRRAINAFGGPRPLPETGMEVDWPTFVEPHLDGIVCAQGTQKTEVTTRDVSFTKGSANIATYAGASDVAYQLLQRSSPSYREQYEKVMLAAWGKVTNNAFVTALEGAAGTTTMAARGLLGPNMAITTSAHADDIFDTTPDHGLTAGDAIVFTSLTGGDDSTAALVGRVVWVSATSLGAKTLRPSLTPGGAPITWGTADITAGTVAKVTDTGARLRAALFEASCAVEDATGSPAGAVLASTDVFLTIAAMTGIVPPTPAGNPSNASGIAEASTLRLESSGLEIVRVPAVTPGKIVVSNSMAAAWHEDGPKWATSEDVAKLGQNVAVYSFAAPAIYVPAGIVELTFV